MPKTATETAISSVPTRLFLVAAAVICLALAGSAGYTFYTLRALHGQYLDRVGHDIAEAIEVQVRGPMRADPAVWRPVFEQALLSYEGQLLFIELIDARGAVLARADSGVDESAAHLVRAELRGPGWGRRAAARRPAAGAQHIRMGIDPEVGRFIIRQGYLHLGVAALAIAALVGLTLYLMRTLSRYLELKKEEEAARNLAALGRLSATLAHEIRNPLGAIKGLTQVVQEELDDRHQARPLTDTVVREAERLEKLVSDLLIFARPRQPKISELDLSALLSETAEILGERFRQANVCLQLETDGAPMRIQSDPDGLRQIVLNLLLNALEATPSGGNVRMSFGRSSASQLSIWIEDSGTGLGDSDLENLFEPFVTTKLKGSGLGLAVSKQIVETLGGELKLENRAEGGARSTVLLPFAD
jgi:signal transduction histidine kinase